ncbi:MAG: hypothetical protein ACR2MS_02715 [Weeksellaceae bacterium]
MNNYMELDDFNKGDKEILNLDFIDHLDSNKTKMYIDTPDVLENKIDEIDKIFNSSLAFNTKVYALHKIYEDLTNIQKAGREGRYLIIKIGEICFLNRKIEDALYNFNYAMKFNDTIGNPFLHLRLGQLQYCIGNKDRMIDELSRALIMGGEEVFENENPMFMKIPKSILKEPMDCSWEDYKGQDWKSTK